MSCHCSFFVDFAIPLDLLEDSPWSLDLLGEVGSIQVSLKHAELDLFVTFLVAFLQPVEELFTDVCSLFLFKRERRKSQAFDKVSVLLDF